MVHVSRFSDGSRKITGITEIVGLQEGFHLDMRDIFVFEHKGLDSGGKVLGVFKPTGYIPLCYEDFITHGIPLDKNVFSS